MKIWTVFVGVKLQPDQHPKTPVIHKVGGYGSGSNIGRGLYALADTWDGGHAGPTSFFTKLCAKARFNPLQVICPRPNKDVSPCRIKTMVSILGSAAFDVSWDSASEGASNASISEIARTVRIFR
jgi:hypothetical protein